MIFSPRSDKNSRTFTVLLGVILFIYIGVINYLYFVTRSGSNLLLDFLQATIYVVIGLIILQEDYKLYRYYIDKPTLLAYIVSSFGYLFYFNLRGTLISGIPVILIALLVTRKSYLRGSIYLQPFSQWKYTILGLGFVIIIHIVGTITTYPFRRIVYSFDIFIRDLIYYFANAIPQEITFRGILFIFLLRTGWSVKKAGVAQIILFLLAHPFYLQQPRMYLVASLLGFLYMWLTWKNKSLFPAIVMHTGYNFFLNLFLALFGR